MRDDRIVGTYLSEILREQDKGKSEKIDEAFDILSSSGGNLLYTVRIEHNQEGVGPIEKSHIGSLRDAIRKAEDHLKLRTLRRESPDYTVTVDLKVISIDLPLHIFGPCVNAEYYSDDDIKRMWDEAQLMYFS
jgi:hypothetical protein